MKILFISAGNSELGISPIILSQGNSLLKKGCHIDYFTIKGKGVFGYLKNRKILKKQINSSDYDIIHAHYANSAFLASLSTRKKIIVSLMGSDVIEKWYFKYVNFLFYLFSWKHVIVKSKEMALNSMGIPTSIIPNGVNFDIFKPIERKDALSITGWDLNKKHILFCSSTERPEKNYNLAFNAFNLIKNTNIQLHSLNNISHDKIPYYINSSDVILMTSLFEGSPNIIKEAMACNTPIVSTNVGDVKDLIFDTDGCYITNQCKYDISKAIQNALSFNNKTNGRSNILHLKDDIIADQLIKIYNKSI
tara:strand:+ start:156 stop:1073 length:918 start_codon:yes stop_codon:yes gene_type:complete